jgi:DNA-binding CsgD family transcriptional regulator
MLQACCDTVAHLFLCPMSSPDQWVNSVARMLTELLDGPVAVQCALVKCIGTLPRWETLHAAVLCSHNHTLADTLLREATTGFPSGDAIIRSGLRNPTDSPHIGSRRTLLTQEQWQLSAMRITRARLGLHEFALAILPLPNDKQHRTIVIQIDALTPEWNPEDNAILELRALHRPLIQSFHEQFLSLETQRESLMGKLSPTQRQLVPLLARGLTEEAIGVIIKRSKHTVHDHAKRIYRAWNISSRHELKQLWHQH